MLETPYFFILVLFVMGYVWYSLLMRFGKKKQ